MDLNEVKKTRTKYKKQFTLAANKLKNYLHIEESKENIKYYYDILERKYDDFTNANLDCEEEGIEDTQEYAQEISKVFNEMNQNYRDLLKAKEENDNMIKAKSYKTNYTRFYHILSVNIDNLLSCNVEDKTICELEEDRDAIDRQLEAVISSLSELAKVANTENEDDNINSTCDKVEKIKRDINIAIKTKSMAAPTSSSVQISPTNAYNLSMIEANDSGEFANRNQNHSENIGVSNMNKHKAEIVQTKKPTLPTFSGNRRDWPEFKTLWRALAEHQFTNKLQLAMELKRSCTRGRAYERLKYILVTNEKAYDEMWSRLIEEYEDPGLSVQSALQSLMTLKGVEEGNNTETVKLIDRIEGIYLQLMELNHSDFVNMNDVDKVSTLLPKGMNRRWQHKYFDLEIQTKLRPFKEFVLFLKKERSVVVRLAELEQAKKNRRPLVETHNIYTKYQPEDNRKDREAGRKTKRFCAIHGEGEHTLPFCHSFKNMSMKEKWDCVRKNNYCPQCLGLGHSIENCRQISWLCKCGGSKHHYMLCNKVSENAHLQKRNSYSGENENKTLRRVDTGTCYTNDCTAYYPVHRVNIKGWNTRVYAFMDSGSNASYITDACAKKHKLKQVNRVSLNISTVGGSKKEQSSNVYEIPFVTSDKKVVVVNAYSLPKITNPSPPVRSVDLVHLFPDFALDSLTRPSTEIDILIGADSYGLHPKVEIAKSGDNLFLMQGPLGVCIVGTHPNLPKETFEDSALCMVDQVCKNTMLLGSHPALTQPHSFILGEEMGIDSVPRCGNCKCGKCPLPGHNLSFKEEQELEMIRNGLTYNAADKCWTSSYPWLISPEQLPQNYSSALATLRGTEKRLLGDTKWAQSYGDQIIDMINRGVARKLSPREIEEWKGPSFYISHLAVVNEKSKSTPVRIVFNSSQVYHGISLNQCLAKGPDSFRNSILGILLRYREEKIALVGDIKKMFHSVFLNNKEKQCHRFLWRDMEVTRIPDTYVMERVNMGDKCAPAIATEALIMTAELHEDRFPRAAQLVKESTYVDDLIDSVESLTTAKDLAKNTELLLAEGNFRVKEWQFSGVNKSESAALKGEGEYIGVLGTQWDPINDTISYQVTLNFSKKKRGIRTGPDLKRNEVSQNIPELLTKRLVLQQVMSIYDPLGLVSPFTLLGKILLRESWKLGLDWDDALPSQLHTRWSEFFKVLFQLEDIQYPRCVKPINAVGNPWLILLSDGSEEAYGCAAYCRWQCTDGSVVVRLIMAKSRIAPINKVSIPKMELNAAVVSKRCRLVIEKELRYTFDRVFHLVDSETVLHQLYKSSTRFNPYEGVRIGEIQAACGGDMSEWAWMPGKDNTSDWLTRGKYPDQLGAETEWFRGPAMLYLPFDQWEIKFGKPGGEHVRVPGERKNLQTCVTEIEQGEVLNYDNIGFKLKAVRVMARIFGIAKGKSFKKGSINNINPALIIDAENYLIKEAQKTIQIDSHNYKALNPARLANGIWVVGASRLAMGNPLGGIYSDLPKLLPTKHPFTRLCMKEAHERDHRGRDSTLATFRNNYWTAAGSKLAKSIVGGCQLCILRNASLMEQEMGSLPVERITPSPPFNFSMLDIFGPYQIRGEVQKRVSGKAWGIIFTDMVARAVHIEAMYGCDTESFLLALRRFVSVRGWPQKLFSDPGSQLVSSEKELKSAIQHCVGDKGMEWTFGVPDSPWHQGAVESLIKSVKKSFKMIVHNHRLTMSEFMTTCYEIANIVNERPLGLQPSIDANINILTPNCLLMGRATASNPNVWVPEYLSIQNRCGLVGEVIAQFWKYWIQYFAPSLVYQKKWNKRSEEIKVGDVVLVLDNDHFKGKYRLALVTETHISKDGKVRTATVSYKNYRTGDKVHEYNGSPYTSIKRSCHRLVRLVPVDK